MALVDALDNLRRDWSLRAEQLSAERLRPLREILARAVLNPGDGRLVIDVLRAASLGAEDAMWIELERQPTRFRRRLRPEVARVLVELRYAVESSLPPTDPDDVEHAAIDRLAVNPAIRFLEDPPTGLLAVPIGDEQFVPAFQLVDRGPDLVAGVVVVNELLEASADPLSAASWWLSPHAALQAVPADLLRLGRGRHVVAAAEALVE